MELQLDRLVLRSWRPEDAPVIAPLLNNYKIWRNTSDRIPHPYTLEDAERYIARALAREPESWFAITLDGAPIGSIGYTPKDDIARISAEFGYWLGEPWWGQGYATEAARGLSDWIFAHRDIWRLEAIVFTHHPASARVLEKSGFTFAWTARKSAIKEGVIRDEWIYEKIRD
jgi:RimJ/RimL family protein N-acetyltransferase